MKSKTCKSLSNNPYSIIAIKRVVGWPVRHPDGDEGKIILADEADQMLTIAFNCGEDAEQVTFAEFGGKGCWKVDFSELNDYDKYSAAKTHSFIRKTVRLMKQRLNNSAYTVDVGSLA